MDGVIVVNKPSGWTSHDVVNKMRRLAGTKKIGHLGTLDPMATGVLPLVVGRATRLAQFFMRGDKKYEGVIRFGHATSTYDREGEITSAHVNVTLDLSQVERELENFRGTILQTPPAVSAKKVDGVPAYKLARKRIPVALKPVEVSIHSFELLEAGSDSLTVRVHCSAGTYLRSLAHDLGQRLGCGAYLEELRRTASGDFEIAQSRTLPELEVLSQEGRMKEVLVPAAKLLPEFPGEVVDSLTVSQIRQGRDFRVSPFRVVRGSKYVKAISPEGDLVAIGEVKLPNVYHPILVM
jgi:tRNA pseudouridine55 synthase